MDGLSAAAGVIGVVSLAIQLGGGAHKLVAFLNTITNAPHEVTCLEDLLNRVYAAATGIKVAFEVRQKLHADLEVPGVDGIHGALSSCLKELVLIQDVPSKVDNIENGRKLIRMTWTKFRLVMKKDDVREVERRLGLSLHFLGILMHANIM